MTAIISGCSRVCEHDPVLASGRGCAPCLQRHVPGQRRTSGPRGSVLGTAAFAFLSTAAWMNRHVFLLLAMPPLKVIGFVITGKTIK